MVMNAIRQHEMSAQQATWNGFWMKILWLSSMMLTLYLEQHEVLGMVSNGRHDSRWVQRTPLLTQ